MLKPVLRFQMISFNYGAKGVRDVDPACRCHQRAMLCLIVFLFCFVLFVYLGVILWAAFICRDMVLGFITITLIGLGKP